MIFPPSLMDAGQGKSVRNKVVISRLPMLSKEDSVDAHQAAMETHCKFSTCTVDDAGVPVAHLANDKQFHDFSKIYQSIPLSLHEKMTWSLASALFDPVVLPEHLSPYTERAYEAVRKAFTCTAAQQKTAC
jgi:hypothetical protein